MKQANDPRILTQAGIRNSGRKSELAQFSRAQLRLRKPYVVIKNIETIRGWIQKLTGTELFSSEIYFLSQLPAEVDSGEVATVVVMTLVLSFLFALFPSWRASRVDPVEGLRYE